MSDTTFTEIDRDHHEKNWPASRETIVVRIDGSLADRVQRRFSRQGEVTVCQYGKEDLASKEYTDTCWVWDSVLCIDGEPVRAERAEAPVFDPKGAITLMPSGPTKMARWLHELERVGA